MKTAQAFRAHLLDMFEPQNHPDDIPYPGAPPRAPYDVTGYNIAYSMGITFDRILEGFDGPSEKLPDVVTPPAGRVAPAGKGGGYVLSHATNDAFVVVNRLLKSNEVVYWRSGTVFAFPGPRPASAIVSKAAEEKGLQFRRRKCADRDETRTCSNRSLGSVRRIDAIRMDAVATGTVPVPVRGCLCENR